jgi:outer membrane protein OmpA-like peptidoglycan-associated protein
LSIEVIGYANSRTSTRAAIAAATARAKAIVAFVKTLGIEATFTTKIVSKGTKNQAVFNLKWVE